MGKGILFIFIFLLLLPAGCGEHGTSPEATLSLFVENWNRENYQEMYNLLSQKSKEKISAAEFIGRYSSISDGIGLAAVMLRDVVIDDNTTSGMTTLTYTLDFQTATVPRFAQGYTATLQQDGTKWFLDWDHHLIFPGLSAEHTVNVRRHKPQRGPITDRNNHPLAAQGQVREIGVVPGRIEDEDALLSGLEQLLDISAESIRKKYNQSWVRPDMFVPIKKITERYWQESMDHFLSIRGVMINRTEGRTYDFPQSLSQTIGYVGEVSAEKLEIVRPLGYRAGDYVGIMGIESSFEQELAGMIGFTILIETPSGDNAEIIAEITPTDGQELQLTIDTQLQEVMHDALGRHTGSAIVLDTQTGELLALASKPDFDSNLFALGITASQFNKLKSLDAPFLNRPLSGLLTPGSIFKPFTALMALSEEVFDPSEAWDTPKEWQENPAWGGYRVTRVERPPGPVDLQKSMKYSDNVYFADLSLKVGWDRFISHAENLGFGETPPLGMQASQTYRSSRRDTLLADSGFGQGELQVTPLHMALCYAAIARGDGQIPAPRIVAGEEATIWRETGYSQQDISLVDRALKAAVQDPDALAYPAHIPGRDIRGKTGTAEIGSGKQIGWFVAYFGDYVLVVALEGDRSMTSRQALDVGRVIITQRF